MRVTITLPPELEQAVTEQAQKQGTAPESLALDKLNACFFPALSAECGANGSKQADALADWGGVVSTGNTPQNATFTVERCRKPRQVIRIPIPRLKNPGQISHFIMEVSEEETSAPL